MADANGTQDLLGEVSIHCSAWPTSRSPRGCTRSRSRPPYAENFDVPDRHFSASAVACLRFRSLFALTSARRISRWAASLASLLHAGQIGHFFLEVLVERSQLLVASLGDLLEQGGIPLVGLRPLALFAGGRVGQPMGRLRLDVGQGPVPLGHDLRIPPFELLPPLLQLLLGAFEPPLLDRLQLGIRLLHVEINPGRSWTGRPRTTSPKRRS